MTRPLLTVKRAPDSKTAATLGLKLRTLRKLEREDRGAALARARLMSWGPLIASEAYTSGPHWVFTIRGG